MAILIGSNNAKKVFNKAMITIGSTPDCDFIVEIGKFPIVLKYSQPHKCYLLVNEYENPNLLFKGLPISGTLQVENVLKLSVSNSNEHLVFKVVDLPQTQEPESVAQNQDKQLPPQSAARKLPPPVFAPEPVVNQQINPALMRHPSQNTQQQSAKPQRQQSSSVNFAVSALEQQKVVLEKERAPIIKQVGFAINDIKNRLSLNDKASIFTHIALFFSSIVTAFGVSNFITGLKIEETSNFINLPMNIKILALFAVIIFGLCLVLKQGVFLVFQNKNHPTPANKSAQTFLLGISSVFFIGLYAINLIYYLNLNPIFSILMSLFFVGLSVVLACAAGYYKSTGHSLAYELDKFEYREDFEAVMNNYRLWIERYINSLSNTKIASLKDKLFNLQLKSVGKIILGIFTAPFLAYGVSNTLASCFPEAAGWIRISGLRFSPVFLVLASFMIVFAFFAFVNAFLSIRKVQASVVIKNDGFSNYMTHGVNILGIQGVRKLETEKKRSLIIGCAIIFIEFTMNTSYFFTEIGGDLQGILLSLIAALVPTALLIAETYMLSQTKFDISAISDLLDRKE